MATKIEVDEDPVAASLKRAQVGATSDRGASKEKFSKLFGWLIWMVIIIAILFVWKDVIRPWLTAPSPKPVAVAPAAPPKPTNPEFHLDLGPGEKSNFIRVDCNQKIRFWDRDNIAAEGTFKTYYCGLGGQNCQEFVPGKPATGARIQFEGNQPEKVTRVAYSLIYVGEQNCR